MVYTILEQLRYRLEENKFQELLSATFEEEVVKYRPMLLKRGMNESMFVEETGIKA